MWIYEWVFSFSPEEMRVAAMRVEASGTLQPSTFFVISNPLARFLMRFHLFLPAKIIMVLLILLIMIMAEEEIGIMTGIICCGIYGFIVFNDFRTLRLQAQD